MSVGSRVHRTLIFLVAGFMLVVPMFSGINEVDAAPKLRSGYEGISYQDMTSINKATFIEHDGQGIMDDLAYLAEVPASTFHSSSDSRVFMNPVIFYEPPKDTSDVERTLNPYPGIAYFMKDMMALESEGLDKIELVGFDGQTPGQVQSEWRTSEVTHLDSDDPYSLSSKIALENWEYSDTAVVAVVDDQPEQVERTFGGTLSGRTPDKSRSSGSLTGTHQPSPVDPNTHGFSIDTDYKYITSQLTWGASWNPFSSITERGKDPDLQLYDMQLGMVGASEKWNVLEGASEEIDSYVYNPGEWEFAVSYMPTENSLVHQDEPWSWGSVPQPSQVTPEQREYYLDNRLNNIRSQRLERGQDPDAPFDDTIEYTIDYTLYPGIDVQTPIETPFYCRDATFKLEWTDNSQDLGLILRGPSGAEIAVSTGATSGTTQVIEVPELGEGDYFVSVVNLGEGSSGSDFTVTYEFKQLKERKEGTSWAGAANGAVIATSKNAPLLFTSESSLHGSVEEAINILGVKEVILIDIDDHSGDSVSDDLSGMRGFLQKLFGNGISITNIEDLETLYKTVKKSTMVDNVQNRDIVFTTINPWTSWNVLEGRDATGNPKEEIPGALFIGPAALAAAVHGAPVFVNDVHSELSCAQAWHNEFWKYAYHHNRAPPSVACMVLTAKMVYSKVIDRYGFDVKSPIDDEGKCKESIVTVADQFDIGSSWDRGFVGGADTGRIMGTPVDTSVWVSRSALYPKVIFANPAVNKELDEHDGMRIQGSESTRVAGKLVITEEEREERVDFPVVNTWVSYQYKFNEQASEYWGCPYTTRTGITPWFDPSGDTDPDGIDPRGHYPDLDSSEVVPHYLEACGYGNVFSTTFEKTTENLNRGAIMWLEVMHGGHTNSGVVGWWDERGATEENPWRGYEETGVPLAGTDLLRLRGATDDPDVVTMSKRVGLDVTPATGPGPGGLLPERHDGVIIAISQQGQTEYSEDGLIMDEEFENLHSMGFSAGSCLIANTYLHLMLVRHGSIFQVIDPWLTSWYSAFAMNMFIRDIYYGRTIGDAYERGISHVGIQYLVDGWWWDIFENLVYYGDPDMKVYSPVNAWEEPEHLAKGSVINGHSPFGSDDHPNAMGNGSIWDIVSVLVLAGLISAGIYIFVKYRKGQRIPVIDRFIKPKRQEL